MDEDANDTSGAFKVGTHDDLVTALGLAVQHVQRWGVAGVVTIVRPDPERREPPWLRRQPSGWTAG